MFTGLIKEIGEIVDFKKPALRIKSSLIYKDISIGDSVSVDGVCLTAIEVKNDILVFHISETTAKISNFNQKDIRSIKYVNLETALSFNDKLDGHFVQGHIDGKAKVISIKSLKYDKIIEFLPLKSIPQKSLLSMIVNKGSITINGISLTVSNVLSSSFEVTIIPHTFANTTLQYLKPHSMVHFEVDMFARYAYNILESNNLKGVKL